MDNPLVHALWIVSDWMTNCLESRSVGETRRGIVCVHNRLYFCRILQKTESFDRVWFWMNPWFEWIWLNEWTPIWMNEWSYLYLVWMCCMSSRRITTSDDIPLPRHQIWVDICPLFWIAIEYAPIHCDAYYFVCYLSFVISYPFPPAQYYCLCSIVAIWNPLCVLLCSLFPFFIPYSRWILFIR